MLQKLKKKRYLSLAVIFLLVVIFAATSPEFLQALAQLIIVTGKMVISITIILSAVILVAYFWAKVFERLKEKFPNLKYPLTPKTEKPVPYKPRVKSEEEVEQDKRRAEQRKAAAEKFRKMFQLWIEAKGIKFKFYDHSKGGHMDIPERRLFDKPVPLTPEELYELILLKDFIRANFKVGEDKIIYADYFYFEDYDRIEYSSDSKAFEDSDEQKS